jgi:cytochrome P450
MKTVNWPRPVDDRELYSYYSELRAAGPVARSDATDSIVVTGFEAATALLKDRAMSSVWMFPRRFYGAADEWLEASNRLRTLIEPQMALLDGDDHKRVRNVVQGSFTPAVVRGMADAVRAMTLEYLRDAGPSFDLISTLAYPLPARVIFEMLAVPEEDRAQFHAWSQTLADFVGTTSVEDDYLRSARTQLEEFADYCGRLAKSQPAGSTPLTLLYEAHEEARISWVEMVGNSMFLLAAGHETTTNLIGNGTLALLSFPDQFALLRSQPELSEAAVEELLRFDTSVQMTIRAATSSVNVCGYHIPAGSHLVIILGAANRDPEAFANPDRLDITRGSRKHLAFSSGVHTCLGAQLARMEAQQVFSVLTEHFSGMELAGEPEYRSNMVFRGLAELPVTVS